MNDAENVGHIESGKSVLLLDNDELFIIYHC